MNILMLGRWLPTPRRAEEAGREHRFARHLARTHSLTLAFVTDEPNPAGCISALRGEFGDIEFAVVPRGWKTLSSAVRLATGESCTMAYHRSEALSTRLGDRMRSTRYDLVHVSSSSMIRYALELDATVPVVMDFGDIDSDWWLRQARARSFPGASFYRTEGLRLRLAETQIARRAARCLVGSPQATRVLATFAPWAPATVIPNGVDSDYFTPVLRHPSTATAVCVSAIETDEDVDAADELFRSVVPRVLARIPDARFVVVAKQPPPSIRRLEQIAGVVVAGPVADMRPFLHRAAIAVAPLPSAHGLQTGILEAMASGVPVITTSQGAEGIPATRGRHLHVEDGTPGFSQRVIELLEDPTLRAEIGAQGRAFVQTHHSWDASAERLSQVIAATLPAMSAMSGVNGAGAPATIPSLARAEARTGARVGGS